MPFVDPLLAATRHGPVRWRRRLVASIDHQPVVDRIVEESGWSPRYAFMIFMSAGIAMLGLLLSSPAVVIGAMLISPLMSPILGLGFSLAMFDFAEMRRSLIALAAGAVIAVLFTATIVLLSPLKAPTAEILARTRPNLFDLLVALFASLAGTFAIIRGKGETITGVAIATALMPPLAVVGYGFATGNMPVLGGALALFATNFVTIALSATIMARIYGFGRHLSPQQSWTQTWLLLAVFVAMAVPLGWSLVLIAREAVTVTQVRAFLSQRFGAQARVTQLDVDFDADPIAVRAVVIAPRSAALDNAAVHAALAARLERPVALQLDQVLLEPGTSALDAQRTELQQARDAAASEQREHELVAMVALAAGIAPDRVTIDRDHRRLEAAAAALPGAGLAAYRALEDRVRGNAEGWNVHIVPPLQPLPEIVFADDADALDAAAQGAVQLSAWAARRWNAPALAVPGLPAGAAPDKPRLDQRRALAVAGLLRQQGIAALPIAGGGQHFRLAPSPAVP